MSGAGENNARSAKSIAFARRRARQNAQKAATALLPAPQHTLRALNTLRNVDRAFTYDPSTRSFVARGARKNSSWSTRGGESAPSATAVPTVGADHIVRGYFKEFNKERVIQCIALSNDYLTDPTSLYYRKDADDIDEVWAAQGDIGTALHTLIERFYDITGVSCEESTSQAAFLQVQGFASTLMGEKYTQELTQLRTVFQQFYDWHVHNVVRGRLVPFRSEVALIHPVYQIQGRIDMLYLLTDGAPPGRARTPLVGRDGRRCVSLVDWKMGTNVDRRVFQNERGAFPLDNVPDTKFWRHAMQVSLYKTLLEDCEPLNVTRMGIVVMHPTQNAAKYMEVRSELVDEALYVCEVNWVKAQTDRLQALRDEVRSLLDTTAQAASVGAPVDASFKTRMDQLREQVDAAHEYYVRHMQGIPMYRALDGSIAAADDTGSSRSATRNELAVAAAHTNRAGTSSDSTGTGRCSTTNAAACADDETAETEALGTTTSTTTTTAGEAVESDELCPLPSAGVSSGYIVRPRTPSRFSPVTSNSGSNSGEEEEEEDSDDGGALSEVAAGENGKDDDDTADAAVVETTTAAAPATEEGSLESPDIALMRRAFLVTISERTRQHGRTRASCSSGGSVSTSTSSKRRGAHRRHGAGAPVRSGGGDDDAEAASVQPSADVRGDDTVSCCSTCGEENTSVAEDVLAPSATEAAAPDAECENATAEAARVVGMEHAAGPDAGAAVVTVETTVIRGAKRAYEPNSGSTSDSDEDEDGDEEDDESSYHPPARSSSSASSSSSSSSTALAPSSSSSSTTSLRSSASSESGHKTSLKRRKRE